MEVFWQLLIEDEEMAEHRSNSVKKSNFNLVTQGHQNINSIHLLSKMTIQHIVLSLLKCQAPLNLPGRKDAEEPLQQ